MVLNNPMGFQRVLVTLGTRSSITGETCTNTYSPDGIGRVFPELDQHLAYKVVHGLSA